LGGPHPEICRTGDIWSERKPPSYPARALRRGSIGAILIGYDVDGTGVSRTVVLTDFTESGFGAAAVNSMKNWRLKPGLDPACWKNLVTIFMFVIN
jgi:outer membrane biosynthesis protein TonB